MKTTNKSKKINLKWLIIGALIVVMAAAVLVAVGAFQISEVEVEGNSYYSDEQIQALVIGDGAAANNSLYVMFQYDYLGGREIPFVDNIEVTLKARNKVKIRVYEKSLIGYVEYMGSKLYFDKDGTVVESSREVLEGVPCINGLKFDTLTLYQPLNVTDAKVFKQILSVTQMMKKYELAPDSISFNEDMEIVLTFAKVRINLGIGDNMDEKAARIQTLMPDLEGKSGVLYMEDYSNETTNISFMKDAE